MDADFDGHVDFVIVSDNDSEEECALVTKIADGVSKSRKQEKRVSRHNDGESGTECLICFDRIANRVISSCGHNSVCALCALRMRHFLKDKSCPFCKNMNNEVVVLKKTKDTEVLSFDKMKSSGELDSLPKDAQTGMFFQSSSDLGHYRKIKSLYCIICDKKGSSRNKSGSKIEKNRFQGLAQLREHLQTTHNKWICEICSDHDHLFPHEFRLFDDEKSLQSHIKYGTPASEAGIGSNPHPECKFCRTLFYDEDQLYTHLNREHFHCHICHKKGSQIYYGTYRQLFKHFSSKHYICSERDCLDKKFVVFDSEVELRGHLLNSHSMSSHERKKLAQVTLDFQFTDSSRATASRPGRRTVNPANVVEQYKFETQRRRGIQDPTSAEEPVVFTIGGDAHINSQAEDSNFVEEKKLESNMQDTRAIDFPELEGARPSTAPSLVSWSRSLTRPSTKVIDFPPLSDSSLQSYPTSKNGVKKKPSNLKKAKNVTAALIKAGQPDWTSPTIGSNSSHPQPANKIPDGILPFPSACSESEKKNVNQNILLKIAALVDSNLKDAHLARFKSISSAYVAGNMEPTEYLDHFLALFPASKSKEASVILMQIISLFPSESLRRNLHISYVQRFSAKPKPELKESKNLQSEGENVRDRSSKLQSRAFDSASDFPSLSSESEKQYSPAVSACSSRRSSGSWSSDFDGIYAHFIDLCSPLGRMKVNISRNNSLNRSLELLGALSMYASYILQLRIIQQGERFYLSDYKRQLISKLIHNNTIEYLGDRFILSKIGLSSHALEHVKRFLQLYEDQAEGNARRAWAMQTLGDVASDDLFLICEFMGNMWEKFLCPFPESYHIIPEEKWAAESGSGSEAAGRKGKKKKQGNKKENLLLQWG